MLPITPHLCLLEAVNYDSTTPRSSTECSTNWATLPNSFPGEFRNLDPPLKRRMLYSLRFLWATGEFYYFGWLTGYDPAASGSTDLRSTDWATATILVEQLGNDPRSPGLQPGAYTMFATVPFCVFVDFKRKHLGGRWDSNPRNPFGYQNHNLAHLTALLQPPYLAQNKRIELFPSEVLETWCIPLCCFVFVRPGNFEIPTPWLKARCSTSELRTQYLF